MVEVSRNINVKYCENIPNNYSGFDAYWTPKCLLSKDKFTSAKNKNKKNGIKSIIIGSVISVVIAATALFVLAKTGKPGTRLKNFADNLFNFKNRIQHRNGNPASSPVSPSKAAGSVTSANPPIQNPPAAAKPPASPITHVTQEQILTQRRSVVDKLQEISGNSKKLKIDENGRINLLSQEVDDAEAQIYKSLREANYKPSGDSTIAEFTDISTPTIKVSHNAQAGDWDYRTPVGFIKEGRATERISLNVRPDRELIRKLDDYFSSHLSDVKGYYKTPGYFEGWSSRHDPITIYLHSSAKNSTVLEDIAKIAAPYARETGTSVLIGKPFGNCCAHIRGAQISDFELLRDRYIKLFGMENYFPTINPYGIRRGCEPHATVGEFWSYNELFNRLTGENVQVLIP